jgi:SAM-dependent methyltransferase
MFFMHPRDIGLFLRSARTDAAIAETRTRLGQEAAFDAAYAAGDPWGSGDARYRYQRRKYDVLMGLLPAGRRFGRALDLGCGAGILSRRLADRADEVLGVDISATAVAQAEIAHADRPHMRFAQGDLANLPAELDGKFDLVVLADTIYYLPPPLRDDVLQALALRVARLLRPGGICLIANHFFWGLDAESRVSRRIHTAFAACPALLMVSAHRRPFYLVSLLEASAPGLG